MNLSLPTALPGALPPASLGQPAGLPAIGPTAPVAQAPAAAGFFLALQQTAQPALWPAAPQDAGTLPATPLLSPLGQPASLAGEALEQPSDEDLEAKDEQPPQGMALPVPLAVPMATTPAFQPHGLALLNTAVPWSMEPAAAPAPAAPSGPAAGMVALAAATTPAPDARLAFAAAVQQAALPPTQPALPASAPQTQVPATLAQAEAVVVPLKKALAAHTTTSTAREAAAMAWNPAAADGLPAPLPLPAAPAAATSAARNDGTQATALVEALGERIDWQIRRGTERAQIRLDPPMQGQLEITVRRDGASLQVHLSATHSDVVRQLHAISDSMRSDLSMRQAGDVAVTIAQHAPREHDGRGRQAQDHAPEHQDPGRALAEAENDQAPQAFALTPSSKRNP